MTAYPRTTSIGVFDSGFGGLDVLRGIVKKIPQYDYAYLGDSHRAPYGPRSQELVYDFTKQAVEFLLRQGCDLVILACHTASSAALRKIQREYLPKHNSAKRVLGVLIPCVEEAVRQTRNKRIGVIGTEGTVASGAFVREIAKRDSAAEVFQNACPLLVPFVEAGKHNSKAAESALKKYLRPLMRSRIDTLILGCTHYGMLKEKILALVGPDVRIVSGADVVPQKLEDYLHRHPEIERTIGTHRRVRFYSTDPTERFRVLGGGFFGESIRAQRVSL